jgi:hypothetical protein
MLRIAILGAALLFVSGKAFAADEAEAKRDPQSVAGSEIQKPSADELRKVVDYFNRGHELMLAEKKFCKDIGKTGDTKNDCVNEVAATELTKGEKAYLWMNFLVPKEFKEGKLLIQFNQNGVTRNARERAISAKDGALRYRVFEMLPTLNPGNYEAVLMLDMNGQTMPLDKFTMTVKPKG